MIDIASSDWEGEDDGDVPDWPTLCENLTHRVLDTLYAENNLKTEVSVVLTNDAAIQELNAQHRSKDKPTNVLSFPVYQLEELDTLTKNSDPQLILGDIVFSYETLKKEAVRDHKPFKHHFCHLFIHGLLHLLGYNHEDQESAERMEALETEILQMMSIPNPYSKVEA